MVGRRKSKREEYERLPESSIDSSIDNGGLDLITSFSLRVDDFFGSVVRKEVAEQRSAQPQYAYGHPARFAVTTENLPEFNSVTVFKDRIVPKNHDETDKDLASFLSMTAITSEALKSKFVKRTESGKLPHDPLPSVTDIS